jgi:enoyl-CoA hydratase/carnithine racemase
MSPSVGLSRNPVLGRSAAGLSSNDQQAQVLLERDRVDPSIAILRLNRPDKLNSITAATGIALRSHVDTLKSDSGLRAVVVTGEGKAFSAGGDLDFLLERMRCTRDANIKTMLDFYSLFLHIRTLPVPVLAAINGAAVGAGMCFALATDIRFAAADAKMGFNFTKLGIHPGMGATHFLPRIVSPQHANDLLMSGALITGEEAKRIGLVREALPSAEVLPKTLELARRIAANSPVAVRTLTATLREQLDRGLSAALKREAEAQAESYAAEDLKEGIAAVRAKRDPVFRSTGAAKM